MKIVAFTQKPFRPLNPNATLALELLHHQHLIYVEHDLKEAAYKWTLEHPDAYLVPLGGFSKSAATSSLSLGNEIAHFHQKQQIDHIILDAGTGLQAAACLIALQEAGFSGQAHVILMGDLDFLNVLHTVASWLDKNIPQFKIMISRPILGKKYGSYHPRLKEFQTLFFQKTGIILDLIYNVKSFHYLYEMIVNKKISGKILIVHSGGTYSATISE